MSTWNNLDTLESFKELSNVKKVNLVEAMTGENGAERVKKYSVPMAAGLAYNYAANTLSLHDALPILKVSKSLQKKHSLLKNTQLSTMAK